MSDGQVVRDLIGFIRDTYHSAEFIPLHVPTFLGNEKDYVCQTIDSTFVSSVGPFVDQFERHMESFTGAARAVATVNGTAALHAALYLAGVRAGDLVLTQALTFVATCNALHHMGAVPVFIDVARDSLGLSPVAAQMWLENHAELDNDGQCHHRSSGQRIRAIVPMHTFGHPVDLDELVVVCERWNLVLVEDAAESLGSFYKGRHTGTIGEYGALSFNGNKVITTGGGGMVLCRDQVAGDRAKHITTTAKVPHPYEFYHDEAGFNYRLPNINAALGCAQMEALPRFLQEKRALAERYAGFFTNTPYQFVQEPAYAHSNYWLNAVLCPDRESREAMLVETNGQGVMTRPVWTLMHRLPAFQDALRDDLAMSEWMEARLVNLPSTPVAGMGASV